MDDVTDNYVRAREFWEHKSEVERNIAALRLSHAEQQAKLMHLPDKVDRLAQLITDLAVQRTTAPPQDQTALAIHRALDALGTKPANAGRFSLSQIIVGLAGLVIAAALGDLFSILPKG